MKMWTQNTQQQLQTNCGSKLQKEIHEIYKNNFILQLKMICNG